MIHPLGQLTKGRSATTTTTTMMMMMMMMTMTMTVTMMGAATEVGAQTPPDCQEDALYRRVYSCFSSRGLRLPVEPGSRQDAGQLLKETQTLNPDAQCQHREVYKAATNCTLTTLEACLTLVNMQGAIPDIARFHRGMDVLCDQKHELDTGCLKRQYPSIVQCGATTVKRLVENSQSLTDDIDDIICISAEVNYDCASEHLKNCGERTQEIFLEQLDKYQVPSVCVDRSPGRPGRKPYVISGGGKAHRSSMTLFLAAVMSLCGVFSFP